MGSTGTFRITIAALTADQANFIDDQMAGLAGARVAVDGWSIGALVPARAVGPYPAGLNATDTDLRYQVVRREWSFTYSKTA